MLEIVIVKQIVLSDSSNAKPVFDQIDLLLSTYLEFLPNV